MRVIKYFSIAIIAASFIIGCSKLKDKNNLPTEPTTLPSLHGEGWTDTASVNFHGRIVLSDTSRGLAYCKRCHGVDLKVGLANKSCFDAGCHSKGFHGQGFGDPTSPRFHKFTIRSKKYDLSGCKYCHGVDYNGGLLSNNKSCSNSGCHIATDNGPEACYTCHGNPVTKFANPPKSLNDDTLTTSRGVGAHDTHLHSPDFTTTLLKCQSCHTVPTAFNSPGHIDINDPNFPRATVSITDTLAFTKTKGTTGTPSYDPNTIKCSNVYCHGNFTNGNHFTPQFNGTNQANCGTCHGDPATGSPLPKAPHLQITTTCACHSDVINSDMVTFKDKSKHIDGKLQVSGQTRTDW